VVPDLDFAAEHSADPRRGIYETLLVVGGRPVAAGAHVERLRASAAALYGAALPDGLDAQLVGAAGPHTLARLRIELVPPGERARSGSAGRPWPRRTAAEPALAFAATAIERTIVMPSQEVAVATVGVTGCAGPHKLLDRSWLEQIEQLAGAEVRPLLVSRSGTLLETTRANVFLVRDGVLATPQLDGSILPGTTRAVLLEHARRLGIEVREMPLTLEQLEAADVVLLSGSVRLLESARRRDRRARGTHRVLARLADALHSEVFA